MASGLQAEDRNVQDLLFTQALLLKLGTRVRHTRMDCSHFVNYVYKKANLPYRYANSSELYQGVDAFERVSEPVPGDLIVWRGHVGIIVDPSANRFVSVLRSGVTTDDYRSRYWKRRGTPRFMRYVGLNLDYQAISQGGANTQGGD